MIDDCRLKKRRMLKRRSNIDEFVKSWKCPVIVIPAFAGVTCKMTFYETINIQYALFNIQFKNGGK